MISLKLGIETTKYENIKKLLFEARKNQGEGAKRRQIWRKTRGREGQKR